MRWLCLFSCGFLFVILVVVLCGLLFVFGYRFAALGYWFVGAQLIVLVITLDMCGFVVLFARCVVFVGLICLLDSWCFACLCLLGITVWLFGVVFVTLCGFGLSMFTLVLVCLMCLFGR